MAKFSEEQSDAIEHFLQKEPKGNILFIGNHDEAAVYLRRNK